MGKEGLKKARNICQLLQKDLKYMGKSKVGDLELNEAVESRPSGIIILNNIVVDPSGVKKNSTWEQTREVKRILELLKL